MIMININSYTLIINIKFKLLKKNKLNIYNIILDLLP